MWDQLNNDPSRFQVNGMDNSIAKFLRSQPDMDENVIQKICNDVTYTDLSALNAIDLEKFGVADENQQSQLISVFSTLTNQEQSLERYVEALNPGDYHEEIYNQVLNQLNAVALVLETIELHAGTNWYNTLVTPNAYISTVLLTILKHFSKKTSAIQLRKKSNKFQWLCCGAFIVFFVAAKKIL